MEQKIIINKSGSVFINFNLSVLFFLFFTLTGCRIFEDFIHMKTLEISSFSPSSSIIEHSSVDSVKITFSAKMNKSRTEESFTLKKESSAVNGKFFWKNNTLLFYPDSGFSENSDYLIEISVNAEDVYGNSLPEKFIFSFSTSEESEIPYFVSSSPADSQEISDPLQPVRIVFSEPLMHETVYSSFSIFPFIKGHLALTDEKTVVFTPLENYTAGCDYTIAFSENLSDLSGNCIICKKELTFFLRDEEPAVLTLLKSSSGEVYMDTEEISVNSSIEKNIKLHFVFDKEVSDSIKTEPCQFKPETDFTTEWNSSSTEAIITFDNHLDYGEIYEVTSDGKTYRFLINGACSRPPVLNRIVYCKDSLSPVYEELKLNRGINFKNSEYAFFDFYFSLADTAVINDIDIFNALTFKTVNGDLSVKPVRVINPQQNMPPPCPLPAENEYVFRIECFITENTAVSPFRIEISSDFKDSLQNKVEEKIIMQVISL